MCSPKNRWHLEYLLIANLIIGILSLIKYTWNNIPNTVFDNGDYIPNTVTVLGIFFYGTISLIPNSVSGAGKFTMVGHRIFV